MAIKQKSGKDSLTAEQALQLQLQERLAQVQREIVHEIQTKGQVIESLLDDIYQPKSKRVH